MKFDENIPSNAQAEWKRSWNVVGASVVGMGTGAGLYQYVSSLFIQPLEASFGWSRGEISSASALGLLGALGAPLIGKLADTYGVRPVATVCILLLSLAHVGLAMMTGPLWQFLICSAIIGIAASGSTGLVYSRAVNGWFKHSRGLALGLMASGISIATLIISPMLAWIIADFGVRMGYLTLAALASLVGLPIVLAGVRERPSQAGEGILTSTALFGNGGFRAALKMRAFWLLAAIMFLVNIPSTGVLTQLVPLLFGKGISGSTGAAFLSLFAVSVLVGRIGVGWLFDRLNAKFVAAAVTFASAVGCLILLSSAPLYLAVAGVVLLGLLQGAETDVLAYFVGRLFDHRHYGTIYGALFTISLMGSATGLAIFGWLFTLSGDYNIALVISASILVVVGGLYLVAPSFSKNARAD